MDFRGLVHREQVRSPVEKNFLEPPIRADRPKILTLNRNDCQLQSNSGHGIKGLIFTVDIVTAEKDPKHMQHGRAKDRLPDRRALVMCLGFTPLPVPLVGTVVRGYVFNIDYKFDVCLVCKYSVPYSKHQYAFITKNSR